MPLSFQRPFSTGFAPLPPGGPWPPWLRIRLPSASPRAAMGARLREAGLHTVCAEAACPNLGHCWKAGRATVMILGDRCTRHCRFCNVTKGPVPPPDPDEPRRLAKAVLESGLKEITVTSVTRDDLPDGGAAIWCECVREIRRMAPGVAIEILVSDFKGDKKAIASVVETRPDIFGHNIETVPRLYKKVRPEADYRRSLDVLRQASEAGLLVKSSMMLGLGETDDEIFETMTDLRQSGAEILYLGQYLRPSPFHVEVSGYLSPEHFSALGEAAKAIGFGFVASAPLVRSSLYQEGQTRYLEKRKSGIA